MNNLDSNPPNVKKTWAKACEQLKLKLSPGVFNTWINNNPLVSLEFKDEQTLLGTIISPTAFHSINVKKNLTGELTNILEKITGQKIELQFKVGSPTQTAPQFGKSFSQAGNNFNQPQSSVLSSPSSDNGLFSSQNLSLSQAQQTNYLAHKAGLRRDYTFSTFAVSSTNEMAHAAATAVSDRPGVAYNPLFLYGGVGVGKTHLMHAVGNNILKNNPEAKVLYSTSETFTNEIVSAIRNKQAMQFKHKYRSAQVLLIDDVQFIAGKNTVQEEFFHTFNALIQNQAQIILTSDRPPHEISLLEDRLRSRFEAGLMIDIQQPTFELRTAILLIKAKAKNINLPMDLAQLVASRVESARKLEGVVQRLQSAVELQKKQVTKELIEQLLENGTTHEEKKHLRVKPQDVIKTVADHFKIKQINIKGQTRVKSVVTARHIAMHLLKNELGLSHAETGRWFADRDHTTVMHAVNKIEAQLQTNFELRQEVMAITTSLTSLSK